MSLITSIIYSTQGIYDELLGNTTTYISSLVIYVLSVVAMWKMFEKAGKAGWKALIPIWNIIILLEISGYSPLLILLFLIPIADIVMCILMCSGLAKAYGKGTGTAVGLFFFNTLFILILGFGNAKYIGNEK